MHANRALMLLLVALTLLAGLFFPPASEAQPLRDEADQILMYFETTEQTKKALQKSLGMVTVRTTLQPGMLEGIHNVRKGVGTFAKCKGRAVLFFPAAIAEGAVASQVKFLDQMPADITLLGTPKDFPIAVGVLNAAPEGSLPLPILESVESIDKGLVLTGIAERGPKILSKVYIVETPKPPLERMRVTDIRIPDGSPMVTPDLHILAIPVRSWGSRDLSLAVHATTLRKICNQEIPIEPIRQKSLEINP